MVISITSGTGSGDKGIITAYNGTTKVATVQKTTTAFTPAASSARTSSSACPAAACS